MDLYFFRRPSSSDFPAITSTHLTHGATTELYNVINDVEEAKELLVIITEALAKHHAADDVGHGAAQQKRGVKWFG